MKEFHNIKVFIFLILTFLVFSEINYSQIKPNIVFVLVDDMGFGDVAAFNPNAKTTTPQLDKLAAEGMIFRDAHVPASSCVPSRYGLLTGRYPFRPSDLPWRTAPIIEANRWTIATVLKNNGYKTGMVGKWHLGFNYSDYNNLTGGPADRGFDYYFGISRSLDQADYYYIENRAATSPPTVNVAPSPGTGQNGIQGPFWRSGLKGTDFNHDEVLNTFIDKSVTFIEDNSAASETLPFFLYLALASPHTPWLPSAQFQGTSPIGEWGDWVAENDDAIGRVIQSVYDQGQKENTLIFFTSDNGPVWWPSDITNTGHEATSLFRGMKFDAWEGGHRMPFIASWPGVIPNNSVSSQIISTTDMFATFAALVGQVLPDNVAEDSYNIWDALLDPNLIEPVRGPFIQRPDRNAPLVIRQGEWKLLDDNVLYNLYNDSSETTNVYNNNRGVAQLLVAIRDSLVNNPKSVPSPRINPITVFGCKDSLSNKYNVDDIVELPGFCPVGVMDGNPYLTANKLYLIQSNVLRILSQGPHKIIVRQLNGAIIKSFKGMGLAEYHITKTKGAGIFVLDMSFGRKKFPMKLYTEI